MNQEHEQEFLSYPVHKETFLAGKPSIILKLS